MYFYSFTCRLFNDVLNNSYPIVLADWMGVNKN